MSKKSLSTKFSLNQEGFTLLEILVVIGMLGVIATFVTPAIGNWRIEKNIEKDFLPW
jgi:prepilin-type N-terminal cleavage/methylation domain-containing protein